MVVWLSSYFLWTLVQESFLVGISLLVIVVPVNLALAKCIKSFYRATMKAADARVATTTR